MGPRPRKIGPISRGTALALPLPVPTPRWFYVLVSALLLGCSALVARGVAALAGAHFLPAYVPPGAPPEAPPVAPLAPAKKLVIETDPAPQAKVPAPLARCAEGRIVVSAIDPLVDERSLVVIETARGKSMARKGGEIDGRRVVAIGVERVILRDGARLCFVDASKPAAAGTGPAVVGTPSPSTMAGIESIDASHFRIERTLRDRLLENHLELMKTLRGGPDLVDGKVVGLRLMAAPLGSVPAALGLRAGDSLRSINGYSLASPEQMLEAFAKLRTAPFLEIQYVRAGQSLGMRLEVL